MKFNLNLKNKEVSIEADVEGLVAKGIERKENNPNRKTAYQIRQEETRKKEELKHKQEMKMFFILLGIVAFFAVFGMIASVLGI